MSIVPLPTAQRVTISIIDAHNMDDDACFKAFVTETYPFVKPQVTHIRGGVPIVLYLFVSTSFCFCSFVDCECGCRTPHEIDDDDDDVRRSVVIEAWKDRGLLGSKCTGLLRFPIDRLELLYVSCRIGKGKMLKFR